MKNIPLFVFTRLGLGVSNEEYYRRVLPLFEAVTLPSLRHQTDPDFHWVIAVDANLPTKARDGLLELVGRDPRIHVLPFDLTELREMHIGSFNWMESQFYRLALGNGQVERPDSFVLSALIDCDDAWHESTVARVRANALDMVPQMILSEEKKVYLAASIAGAVMTFPDGYQWHAFTGGTAPMHYPWLSMSIFVVSRFSSGIHAFSCRHDGWPHMAEIVTFETRQMDRSLPMWIHTRHGDNLSASFSSGGPAGASAAADLSGFHLDSAALARWRESLPAGKADERPEKHQLAFRQYALMFRLAALNKQIDSLHAALAHAYSTRLADLLHDALQSRDTLVNEYRGNAKRI